METETLDVKEILDSFRPQLTERHKEILTAYAHTRTLREAGQATGISRQRVAQVADLVKSRRGKRKEQLRSENVRLVQSFVASCMHRQCIWCTAEIPTGTHAKTLFCSTCRPFRKALTFVRSRTRAWVRNPQNILALTQAAYHIRKYGIRPEDLRCL